MREPLEEHLATRLGTLGETVGDDLVPPADLELQVLRRRRQSRRARRWSGLAVAAAVVIVIVTTSVAVVHGSSGHGSLRVESSTTGATVPLRDALQPGTAMLSARGQYVLSLDSGGHQNATMIKVKLGNITYARATDDHRELWYLSLKNGTKTCGDVVRADIDRGNSSTIVTRAVTFDVSPDGSRLALYGAGDLAHGQCAPVLPGTAGNVVVVDQATATSSSVGLSDVTSLRWSPDSSFLVASTCGAYECGFRRIGVPPVLPAPLSVSEGTSAGFARIPAGSADRIVFGPDGLYELAQTVTPGLVSAAPSVTQSISRYDPQTLGSPQVVFRGGAKWDVAQVVPTGTATYVIAAPTATPKATGLYRVVSGRLALVRTLDAPGTFTPVSPFSPGG